MAAKKKQPGPRARARQAAAAEAAKTSTPKKPKTSDERYAEWQEREAKRQAKVDAGAKLNDFLADYGFDAEGRTIDDPAHTFHQMAQDDPEAYSDIREHYGLDNLSFEVKDLLGLSGMDVSESGRGRGGLPTGETRVNYQDPTVSIEDDPHVGSDTGYLSEQLAGRSGSALGARTFGDLSRRQPTGTSGETPQRSNTLATPRSRRQRVLPRLSQVRAALSRTEMGVGSAVEGKALAPKDVAESRRLSDVPKDPRWTDLGLLPATSARREARKENQTRAELGEATVRLELERQADPSKQLVIPRTLRTEGINPALLEAVGPQEDWHPETKAFFRKSKFSGIAGGTVAGGSSIKGADAVTRKANTYRVGRPVGSSGQMLMTGTSSRFPKGAVINVDQDKLSGQFNISNVDLETGETIERPDLAMRMVAGTSGGDPRAAEFELANPLDESVPNPMDKDQYTPRYAVTGLPIDDPEQEADARAYQAEKLAGGAQPWQTGIPARGAGKQTQPRFGRREQGSGTGQRPTPSPDIIKSARESGQSPEDALMVMRELGGRFQEIEEIMQPAEGGSPYEPKEFLRKPSRTAQDYVTNRRIQVPRASGALRKNKETGVTERATTGYQVFAPSETQIQDYLDAMSIEPGSKQEADIVKRMDTGVGSFVSKKMTKAQKAEPMRDTSQGGKRSTKVLKQAGVNIVKDSSVPGGTRGELTKPVSGQFSEVFEARLRAGEQKRQDEAATREGAYKALREGPNAESDYDTPGYMQSWDKLESVQGRGIMAPARMNAEDFSSRLLGTDIEQFTADQLPPKESVTSKRRYGVVYRGGESYNRPAEDEFAGRTSPGGRSLMGVNATPFAAFATAAPDVSTAPARSVAVPSSPQFDAIRKAMSRNTPQE